MKRCEAVTSGRRLTSLGKVHRGSRHNALAIPPRSPDSLSRSRTSIPPLACTRKIRRSVGTFSQRSPGQVRPRLRSEPLPIGAGADSGVALKELPKESSILIADGATDLLHGAMVALEKALGCGDS